MGSASSVKKLLATLDVDVEEVSMETSLAGEFSAIKRFYNKKVLVAHPDKGGDPKTFREVRKAFETIRIMFEKRELDSFVSKSAGSQKAMNEAYANAMRNVDTEGRTYSYEFYENAAHSDIPTYRVELAKSNRSTCKKSKEKIPKGEVRFGNWDVENGGYGRWVHWKYWRVPSKVWLGLANAALGPLNPNAPPPDDSPAGAAEAGSTLATSEYEDVRARLHEMNEVLLEGLNDLPPEKERDVILHVMDRRNWAKQVKRKLKDPEDVDRMKEQWAGHTMALSPTKKKPKLEVVEVPSGSGDAGKQLARAKPKFQMPKPGVGGATAGSLAGKRCVLTGVFPEVGGGGGLTLGKDKVKAMIESFGGVVTGSLSGKTDYLVVGKEPGASKVTKARKQNIPLLEFGQLAAGLGTGKVEAAVAEAIQSPMVVKEFSKGFVGKGGASNGLALTMKTEQLEQAMGVRPMDGVAIAKDPYQKMTCKELRAMLKEYGVGGCGNKARLIQKLKEAMAKN